MIKIENVQVTGFEPAIRGMRNPMNSWDKSDSFILPGVIMFDKCNDRWECNGYEFEVSPNDHKLMLKLAKSGSDHAKYRRMIIVYADILAPLYWWKEFDTYKVGTVANSCSTMHKIHEKEFGIEDFSCEHLSGYDNEPGISTFFSREADELLSSKGTLNVIIEALNDYRKEYFFTKDKFYWWQMIQLLPTSYNQRRTVMLNYEVLANMYNSRKDHKLDEWREFCKWIKTLPYSEIITLEE